LCGVAAIVLLAWAAGGLPSASLAQPGLRGAAETAESPVPAGEPGSQAQRQRALKDIEDALAASSESRERLEREIDEIKADRAKLNAALLDAGERARAAEERIRRTEERLQTLTTSEAAIRRSLEARRGVIVEVLAALQRMGRRPLPAVLVRPEDMLGAVRTAMLLGAVVPDLRGETEALATDLGELVRLKQAIAADSQALNLEVARLAAEQQRLTALTAARQEQLAEAQQSFVRERERAAELGAQARSLKELIERMEREVASAQRKAGEPGRAHEARARFAAAAVRDPARLAPKIPFSEARGLVPLPVGGDVVRAFGIPDGYGGTTRGISITTRPKAVVSSPADGWVVFAGPFRSFGRLLIINAGTGYYLLLAGMDHISVEVGQFVLAGEPVATMGEASLVSPAAGAIETNDPVLYVEFRKDGGSIDPGPWWAKSQSEKVRG
jgi:septal ring factor EnvC (AmiA/AmiB activator)